jgi:hypothetical protein
VSAPKATEHIAATLKRRCQVAPRMYSTYLPISDSQEDEASKLSGNSILLHRSCNLVAFTTAPADPEIEIV